METLLRPVDRIDHSVDTPRSHGRGYKFERPSVYRVVHDWLATLHSRSSRYAVCTLAKFSMKFWGTERQTFWYTQRGCIFDTPLSQPFLLLSIISKRLSIELLLMAATVPVPLVAVVTIAVSARCCMSVRSGPAGPFATCQACQVERARSTVDHFWIRKANCT